VASWHDLRQGALRDMTREVGGALGNFGIALLVICVMIVFFPPRQRTVLATTVPLVDRHKRRLGETVPLFESAQVGQLFQFG
jgi:hypothetical protein